MMNEPTISHTISSAREWYNNSWPPAFISTMNTSRAMATKPAGIFVATHKVIADKKANKDTLAPYPRFSIRAMTGKKRKWTPIIAHVFFGKRLTNRVNGRRACAYFAPRSSSLSYLFKGTHAIGNRKSDRDLPYRGFSTVFNPFWCVEYGFFQCCRLGDDAEISVNPSTIIHFCSFSNCTGNCNDWDVMLFRNTCNFRWYFPIWRLKIQATFCSEDDISSGNLFFNIKYSL